MRKKKLNEKQRRFLKLVSDLKDLFNSNNKSFTTKKQIMKKLMTVSIFTFISLLSTAQLDSIKMTNMIGDQWLFKTSNKYFDINNLPLNDGTYLSTFYYKDSIIDAKVFIITRKDSTITEIIPTRSNSTLTKKDFNKLDYYEKSVVKNWCKNNDVVYPIYQDTTITEENKWEVVEYANKEKIIDEYKTKKAAEDADRKRVTNPNPGGNPYYYYYSYYNAYRPIIMYNPNLGSYSIIR